MSSDSDCCWTSGDFLNDSTDGQIALSDLDLLKARAWRSTEYFDDDMDKFDGVARNGNCIMEILLAQLNNIRRSS